ncbi:ABC transporter permease [Raineya orbicola]|jgi:putative ABC transport system permease protein|uniref:ABC-type antimicrobial peptide transport system permease component n=1 Tax=Raineya orbicola TaxID=2016530 RepID=A0A2N3IIB5_9BACT|nr:ABC transporter permease [Raineya orbicola]PKQ69998.1 ABC-type antimicrobial peptide transport system permease component [Raineya orbicola]
MLLLTRLIWESFSFALQALRANLLRTVLSLLGVTIGIFAIITIFTVVDSLERSIRQSLAFLGDKVIYVQKWPWIFGPDYPWWRYINRPVANLEEMKFLEENLKTASGVALYVVRPNATAKYLGNSMEGVSVIGATYGYSKVSEVKIREGRYFSQKEVEAGRNIVLIGDEVAKKLFTGQNPLGKEIRVKGQKFTIIGVMEREGENFLGAPRRDIQCIIPYGAFTRMYKISIFGIQPTISLKGFDEDKDLMNLEAETRSLMRIKRGLKPKDEDNFALNRPEMIAREVSSIFGVISFAGAIIGSFAILVGVFGIANIMFVSVKERTHIIGIQKALGAKNYFILFQFLFEAIFLSLIGGAIGIGLVFLITLIPQESLELQMSLKNILVGFSVSAMAGLIAGIIPAWNASTLDPVEAIRSK